MPDAENFRFSEDVKNGNDHSYTSMDEIPPDHGLAKCSTGEHNLIGNDYGHFICSICGYCDACGK